MSTWEQLRAQMLSTLTDEQVQSAHLLALEHFVDEEYTQRTVQQQEVLAWSVVHWRKECQRREIPTKVMEFIQVAR